MYPRGTPDIAWNDLVSATGHVFKPGECDLASVDGWSSEHNLPTLSVRSGFDLILRGLDCPDGSEVICSAITIPGMIRIIRHHDLVPVPVDVDRNTLCVDVDQLEEALTSSTRAILIAHLFGSRMNMDPIAKFANKHDLYLIEDCAQAFGNDGYRGHADTDVTMFSFGPIKTATALGGGVLRVKDPKQKYRFEEIQAGYPVQPRRVFLKRIVKFIGLKLLARASLFGPFSLLCQILGTNHDDVIVSSTRGFPGEWSIERFRKRPSAPLRALLHRRLRQDHRARIQTRTQFAEAIYDRLPAERCPGHSAPEHVYWIIPVISDHPDRLVKRLWDNGYDATRRGSSLEVLQPPENGDYPTPEQALSFMDNVIYLPVYPSMSEEAVKRLVNIIREEFDNHE